MSMEHERSEEIEKYLRGDLLTPEKEAFEYRLRQDAALAEEVDAHRTAIFLIKAEEIRKMKQQLESYSAFPKSAQKESNGWMYKWYTWAAAASVALLVTYTFLTPDRVKDPQRLFAVYFVPPPTDRQLLRNESEHDERTQAFLAYEQGHYNEATGLFENVMKNSTDDELLFYGGASALADNQPEKAISYFTELLKYPATLYQRRTQWYLSLAYLRSGQLEKARQYLQILAAESNSYSPKSKDLLEDME